MNSSEILLIDDQFGPKFRQIININVEEYVSKYSKN